MPKSNLEYFCRHRNSRQSEAIRVFSKTAQQSEVELVSGAYPSHLDEVVLDEQLSNRYHIGDSISLNEVKISVIIKTATSLKSPDLLIRVKFYRKNSKGSLNCRKWGLIRICYCSTRKF